MLGSILTGAASLGQMAIGGITSAIQGRRGRKIAAAAQNELGRAMSTWKDYESAGQLQNQYNTLNAQVGGRSTLTGLMQEQADRSMANYLDVVRQGSVSSAQLQGGAANAANMYGQQMTQGAIAGYEDQQRKRQQLIGLAGGLESANQFKFSANLTPYLQRIENAQAKLGYGMNMHNQGISGLTSTLSAGLGALDFDFLNNIEFGKGKLPKIKDPGKKGNAPVFTYNNASK